MPIQQIIPTQLLNVAAHIGASKQNWMTNSIRFIYGFRKGVTIINLAYTTFHLRRALLFVQKVVSKGGIIIINSLYLKTNIALINRFYQIGQMVAPNDWIGGYLSNYKSLKRKIISKVKSRAFVSALINLNYNIDNRFISSEAYNMRIPIVSIFDTNSQSSLFDYPIPTNNKNSSVRNFYAFLFSSSVYAGLIKKVSGKKIRIMGYRDQIKKSSTCLLYNNPSHLKYKLDLYIQKFYIFFKKNIKFLDIKYKIFLVKFTQLQDVLYRIFKKRFLFKELVTKIDIISVFLDYALEKDLYKLKSIKFISAITKRNSKIFRIFNKNRSFLSVFSRFPITYISSIRFLEDFSDEMIKKNSPFMGKKMESIKPDPKQFHYIKHLRKLIISNSEIYFYPLRKEFLRYKESIEHEIFYKDENIRDRSPKYFFWARHSAMSSIQSIKDIKSYNRIDKSLKSNKSF